MSIAVSGSVHSTIKMSPRLRLAERLPGAQRRQRAFEAAQIEGLFGHFVRVVEAAKGPYHIGDGRRFQHPAHFTLNAARRGSCARRLARRQRQAAKIRVGNGAQTSRWPTTSSRRSVRHIRSRCATDFRSKPPRSPTPVPTRRCAAVDDATDRGRRAAAERNRCRAAARCRCAARRARRGHRAGRARRGSLACRRRCQPQTRYCAAPASDCAQSTARLRGGGIAEVNVREPRIGIVRGRAATTPAIDCGAATMLARFVGQAGGAGHGEIDATP